MPEKFSPKQEKPNIGAGMPAWSEKLKAVGLKLSRQLDEPRNLGFEGLETLDLPRYKRAVMPLEAFMKNPERIMRGLKSERFFTYLQPLKTGDKPKRKVGADKEEVLAFLSSIPKEQQKKL